MSRGERDQYFPVARELIAADVTTGIDLYLEVAGRHVLYRSGRQPLDKQALSKLMRRQVDTLYVPLHQSEAFNAYMAGHAGALLEQAKTTAQRTDILRGAARGALSTALSRLDDPQAFEQVRTVAELTVEQVAADVGMMSGLVQFTEGDGRLLTHTLNVTAYAVALGARHGLDPVSLRSLGTGAMLHDVGLSSVDEELLAKSEPLTDVEREFVGRHPGRGREILEAASIRDPVVLDIVLQHHGQTGREPQSLPAQIVQVADAFDALTNEGGEQSPAGPFAALYQMRYRAEVRFPASLMREFVLLLGGMAVVDSNSPIAPLSRRRSRKVRQVTRMRRAS